jgi:uncharacterized HAD superfamily protein
LTNVIVRNVGLFPRDLDCVVGVSRIGVLAGAAAALVLDVPVADLEGFLEGRMLSADGRGRRPGEARSLAEMRRILVIDGDGGNGAALAEARDRLRKAYPDKSFFVCAVFGNGLDASVVDLELEAVPQPSMFQWNIMHHEMLQQCCVDIDGVLCVDPTEDENDDGEAYIDFVLNAPPLHTPTQTLGYLVTSRLERYRPQTEAWLGNRGIRFRELIMLDLPSKEERKRTNAHGAFKANVYRRLDAPLFIESDPRQAETIARLSGKPVLCVGTQQVFYPEASDPHAAFGFGGRFEAIRRIARHSRLAPARSALRSFLGDETYSRLNLVLRRAMHSK